MLSICSFSYLIGAWCRLNRGHKPPSVRQTFINSKRCWFWSLVKNVANYFTHLRRQFARPTEYQISEMRSEQLQLQPPLSEINFELAEFGRMRLFCARNCGQRLVSLAIPCDVVWSLVSECVCARARDKCRRTELQSPLTAVLCLSSNAMVDDSIAHSL